MRADDPFACILLPPAFGLAIIHDKIGLQIAVSAEIEHLTIETPVKDNRSIAERQ